ncbi:hypothetical protein KIS1582_5003 [Cytobacillus firmus]|uniref:Uncharacterized protein n=1 Tax=Cytobacillus firmus TaxID=1399 RepID=A0A800MRR0_CYTFI|nr:hypothetical protein KIS1582_5003 [Cytobacillus firmus]
MEKSIDWKEFLKEYFKRMEKEKKKLEFKVIKNDKK